MLSGTLEINPNQPSQEKLKSAQFAENPAVGISSLIALVIKDVADKIIPDEQEYITTLGMDWEQ